MITATRLAGPSANQSQVVLRLRAAPARGHPEGGGTHIHDEREQELPDPSWYRFELEDAETTLSLSSALPCQGCIWAERREVCRTRPMTPRRGVAPLQGRRVECDVAHLRETCSPGTRMC